MQVTVNDPVCTITTSTSHNLEPGDIVLLDSVTLPGGTGFSTDFEDKLFRRNFNGSNYQQLLQLHKVVMLELLFLRVEVLQLSLMRKWVQLHNLMVMVLVYHNGTWSVPGAATSTLN